MTQLLTSDITSEILLVEGDEVILTHEHALVSSSSQPGRWYTVANGTCDCKGFEYRRTCRHVRAVEIAQRQPSRPQRSSCPSCGKTKSLILDETICASCLLTRDTECPL